MNHLKSVEENLEYYSLESVDLYLHHISNQIRLIDQKIGMKIENKITYTYNDQLKKIDQIQLPISEA